MLIPMLNEGSSIALVITDLRRHFDQILCVDDGSSDTSAAVAEAAGAVVLRHAVNLGQGAALQTGFDYLLRHTNASHVVTFDADGQHSADDALRMFRVAVDRDMDVVLASRFLGQVENITRGRLLVLRAAVWFSRRFTGLDLTDTHNGLRTLSRRAFTAIQLRQPRMAYASELESAVLRHHLTWVEEPTTVVYTDYSRGKGQRNINAVNIVFDLALHRLLRAS